MIIGASGDLLAAEVDALVNTVNCVGVMGKGIALQFKRRYPDMFKAYTQACKRGEVQIGQMHVVPTGQISGPKWIINFPTKQHWRAPSRLEYVESGLRDLVRVVREHNIESVALPPLGAGNGGLDWNDVEPLIRAAFAGLPDVEVHLYAPSAQRRSVAAASGVRMTWGRAMMLELLRKYVVQREAAEPWEDPRGASHLEIQKLMYFANEAEPRLRLDFEPGRYGPYSEKVRHLIQGMEGSMVEGHGDGAAKVLDLEPIAPTATAQELLDAYLTEHDSDTQRQVVASVLEIIDGFEGPYGLELLASTHWVARHQPSATNIAEGVRGWTKRKGRIFTDDHVNSALDHLTAVSAVPALHV